MNPLFLLFETAGDWLDRMLDRLTTYRLVLYTLIVYILAATGLSFAHKVAFTPRQIIISTLWILLISRVVNKLLARFFKVPANHESDLITGLILALILNPLTANIDYVTLAAAAAAAMVSKYVITLRGRHVFNPAAAGAFVSIVGFHSYASWWVGTKPMFPILAIGGLLIIKKMKRFWMVGTFLWVYAAILIISSTTGHAVANLETGALATSLLFFATVMLTEPLTSPTTFNKSIFYAVLVSLLYSVNRLHFAPEEALLAGNVLTFLMSPNRSMVLHFIGKRRDAEDIFSYYFEVKKPLNFKAGQYLEWTLPGVTVDKRGNRRYLTIASSPTEKQIMFTVKVPDQPSGFKVTLNKLRPGDHILAAQLAGDFTLPKKLDSKLAFIAGGIGVTPFRSMAKYMLDSNVRTDAKLLYFASSPGEFAFKDLFGAARQAGLETEYLNGKADEESLRRLLPDAYERTFYISGPQGFVAAVRQALLRMGVEHSQIITDFFPGYN